METGCVLPLQLNFLSGRLGNQIKIEAKEKSLYIPK